MQWFRMYAEFASDPKVQSVSETFQRRFIMFLCLQCNDDLDKLSDEELAFALRISAQELAETLALFASKGFITPDRKISNWNKRQYVSDNSTERVRKHREKTKTGNETLQKRRETVSVTPPETDTDTDTERKQKRAARRCPAEFTPDETASLAILPDLDFPAELLKFRDWEFKTARTDWSACWRTWLRNCKDRGQYAKKGKKGWY